MCGLQMREKKSEGWQAPTSEDRKEGEEQKGIQRKLYFQIGHFDIY